METGNNPCGESSLQCDTKRHNRTSKKMKNKKELLLLELFQMSY